jgi:hypothetical protein
MCEQRQTVLPAEARSTCTRAVEVFCRELSPGGLRACFPSMDSCRTGQGRHDFYPAAACQTSK